MIDNKRVLRTGALASAMTIVFLVFAFRGPEWTKSVSSEFIVYGATANTAGGGPTSTRVIPEIIAGGFGSDTVSGTVIEIVNPNALPVMVSGNFYEEDGSPSVSTYATNLISQPTFRGSFSNLNLPAGSILVLSVGTSPETTPDTGTINWGKISASNTISVSSFFELRRKGSNLLLSRVGIPSSRPDMTTFLIPRLREKQVLANGSNEIETGFAVVNTGAVTATITAKLIDANASLIAFASFSVPANAHQSGIVNSAFSFLSGETTDRQYQYILFSSDQPAIGAAAIAFEGGTLTSFPVDSLQ